MKFSTITISALAVIASAKESHARRRLNPTIVDDESSMSYMLSPNGGGSSSKSSKAPTGSPTGAPTPSPTTSPTPEPKPGECGSTINTGYGNSNVFTLQKNLQCDCSDDPALTVGGQGIVLKLNGYTVECKTFGGFSFSLPIAINVVGTANTIKGPGTVKGGGSFSNGIDLSDGGFHTVNGVTIGPDVDRGISIQSNDNTVINNFITDAGVVVNGNDMNVIKGNTITKARSFGINLDINTDDRSTSDDNKILDNTIISSGRDGILVGGKRVVIQGNTINQSGESGILVDFGTLDSFTSEDVIIKGNSITNSNENGIEISSLGLNTVVLDNTLAGNDGNLLDFGSNTVKAGNIPNLM